jgi:hypothetical protein
MCLESQKSYVTLPNGWEHIVGGIDDESNAFCPDHKAIAEFQSNQCLGCVGGWGDCDLWKGFAYGKLTLTGDDFKQIESGICPKRTNGTFGIKQEKIEKIDLSERSTNESGLALVSAIHQYCNKYHS